MSRGRSAARVALGILGSRLSGLVRMKVLAHFFGVSPYADVLFFAMHIYEEDSSRCAYLAYLDSTGVFDGDGQTRRKVHQALVEGYFAAAAVRGLRFVQLWVQPPNSEDNREHLFFTCTTVAHAQAPVGKP